MKYLSATLCILGAANIVAGLVFTNGATIVIGVCAVVGGIGYHFGRTK